MIWRLCFYVTICAAVIGPKIFASCGSATCPLHADQHLAAGQLQVSFVHEYINQNRIYVGSERSFVGAIHYDHDEVQTLNERSVFQLHYGIVDRLGFSVDVPFVHREHSHIHNEEAVVDVSPGRRESHITHGESLAWESWSFSGMGDVVLSGNAALLLPAGEFEPYLGITVGLKLPTGVTDVRNTEGEEAEVTLLPGTGSNDFMVGVNYRQSLLTVQTLTGEYGTLPLTLGATYQVNGKGKDDWRFGNSLVASIGTEYRLTKHATLLFQVDVKFQGFADAGLTGEPRENTGGVWLFASPGLAAQLSDVFSGFAYAQVPVHTNVHGIQQTSDFNLQFGLRANVGLLE